jgi:hypothetical protein
MIVRGVRWFVRMESYCFRQTLCRVVTSIDLQYWREIKHTPSGVWIEGPYEAPFIRGAFFVNKRWMKLGARKQFAHEDMDSAFESLKARKLSYRHILKSRLEETEAVLDQLDENFQNLTGRSDYHVSFDTVDLGTFFNGHPVSTVASGSNLSQVDWSRLDLDELERPDDRS